MSVSARMHPFKVVACREYDIIVPFFCHRCGNCCRNYEPVIEFELLPEIAHATGGTIDAIQNRLRADSLSHSAGQPRDCCFLDPLQLRCIIYEIRPTACRQFPALGGFGVGAVDCPGYREHRSVLDEFTARLKEIPGGPAGSARGRRPIPPDAREDVLHILSAARVSDGYRRVFETLNG